MYVHTNVMCCNLEKIKIKDLLVCSCMTEFSKSRGSRRVIYKLSRGNERETVVNPKTGTGRERKQKKKRSQMR